MPAPTEPVSLDVLVTVSDTTPQNWVNECRRTVAAAAAMAGFPVTVIESPAVPGHIGQAIRNGLDKCTAPFVTWVDDDDFVLPNAFSCLKEALEANPQAVCAREISLLANGRWVFRPGRHHLSVWSRDVIARAEVEAHPVDPLVHLFSLVEEEQIVDVMSWIYVRRVYRSGGMKLRREHNGRIRR